MKSKSIKEDLISLYIHIPFCKRKCNYCDFLSFASTDEKSTDEKKKQYIDSLINEIKYTSKIIKKYQIKTVFIGGGTPSLLEKGEVFRLFLALRKYLNISDDAEITIEINPGTLSEEKIAEYRECRINRISIGLQSADDKELALLGRIHNYNTFEENYRMLRKCGFDNINIDLISGLPGQTYSNVEDTLKKVIALKPEHISVYGLIIEETTPFYELYGPDKPKEEMLPDEETERKMYHEAKRILDENGYKHYEISNFSIDGKQCKHNLVYWKRGNYIGLGLGASSMIENVRFKNTVSLEEYMELFSISDIDEKFEKKYKESLEEYEILSKKSIIEEYMILRLRLLEGVDLEHFYNTFNIRLFEIPGYKKHTLEMLENKLLKLENNRLFLTERGLDLANYVMQGYCIAE